ncbi:hypothetical protein QR680_004391 [Steinernema hermaphroditum]|uniref:F-box domain-containing protein n=1 Tax=Steinernema hermaphroditum TaxID=289476 RepID=A0AA39HPN1_9BILA|nr:hypothetical protein QR680_004391 [Steinernema hermaphroditum]
MTTSSLSFNELPEHLIIDIFREVFFDDLLNCILTCKRWKWIIYGTIGFQKDDDIEIRLNADSPKTDKQRLGHCQIAVYTNLTNGDIHKERQLLKEQIPKFLGQTEFKHLISLSLPETAAHHLPFMLYSLPRLKELSIYRVKEAREGLRDLLETLLNYVKKNTNMQRLSFLEQHNQELYDIVPFNYSQFVDVFINRHRFQVLGMPCNPLFDNETLPKIISQLLEWPRMCHVLSYNQAITHPQVATSWPSFQVVPLQRCDYAPKRFTSEHSFLKFFWYSDELWLLVVRLFDVHIEIDCSKAEDSEFFSEYLRIVAVPEEVTVYRKGIHDEFEGLRPGPKERLPFGYQYKEGVLYFVCHVRTDQPEIYDGYTWSFENQPITVTLSTSSEELPDVCYDHPLLNCNIVELDEEPDEEPEEEPEEESEEESEEDD